jgi:hypothetical protein
MSQDETLRLVAEVVNKWSGPLRKMQEDLRALGGETKKIHADGVAHAKLHGEAFERLKKATDGARDAITEGMKPAMGALGISALTVAGAIAAVTEAVKDFASATPKLVYLARETRMTVDHLRVLEALGERVGSSSEAMASGLGQFAEHMAKLRRGAPAELNAWRDMGPAVESFGLSLRRLSADQQVERTLKFLGTIRDQDHKRRFLGFLGLPRELANLTGSELRDAIADISRHIGSIGPEAQKRALQAKDAFDRIRESAGRLKDELAIELAPAVTKAADGITKFLQGPKTKSELLDALKEIKTTIDAIATGAGVVKNAIEWLDAHSPGGLVGQRDTIRFRSRHYRQDSSAAGARRLWNFMNSPAPEHGPGSGHFAYELWRKLFSGSSAPGKVGAPLPPDLKDSIKKGTEEGTESGLQKFYDRLGSWSPISYQPGGGAPRAYGGGKFKVYGPGGGAGAIKSSLGTPGSGGVTQGAADTAAAAAAAAGGGGQTRGDRNNNPGNLKYGPFAIAHGATGEDAKGFAIFPNTATGARAAQSLLRDHYSGMTLRQIAHKYTETNPKGWAATVSRVTGIGLDTPIDFSQPGMADRVFRGIQRAEGTGGTAAGRANFMRGQFGGIGQNITSVQTAGGHRFTANAASAAAFKGFVQDLEKAAAPISSIGGFNARRIAGSGRWSQHAFGNALDIDQVGRNVVTKPFGDWARTHGPALRAAMKRWGIISGGDWSNPDFGHFEWGGVSPHQLGWGRARLARHAQHAMGGKNGNDGHAHLRIDLNGFPHRTRTRLAHGGLFKEVSLSRGRSMTIASQDA